jgi:hypothetical protein
MSVGRPDSQLGMKLLPTTLTLLLRHTRRALAPSHYTITPHHRIPHYPAQR